MSAAQRFARAWGTLEEELDWPALGRLHCHEGGDDFFGREARAELFDAALLLTTDLEGHLGRGGRSLYVGASVAELVPMLVETIVLGRRVLWHELDGPVTRELARAVARARERCGEELPLPDTRGLQAVEPCSCDHLWLVSVLTDPDHFPALHDELYGRTGELATGRGERGEEERRARELVGVALGCLGAPAYLCTTDEELGIVRAVCEARGLRLEVPESARLSPVVGDPVRVCRVRAR